jgi:hypothetical protein
LTGNSLFLYIIPAEVRHESVKYLISANEGPFRRDGWFVFFEAALRMPGIRYDGAPEDLNVKGGGIKK